MQPPAAPVATLQTTYRCCGKPNCRCTRGKLHGPYFRRVWREDGRQRAVYVRKADAERVRGEIDHARAVRLEQRQAERESALELGEILTAADAVRNADAIFAQLAAVRAKYTTPQVVAARGRR